MENFNNWGVECAMVINIRPSLYKKIASPKLLFTRELNFYFISILALPQNANLR